MTHWFTLLLMSVTRFLSNHFHACVRTSVFSFVSQGSLQDPVPLLQGKLVDSLEQEKEQ